MICLTILWCLMALVDCAALATCAYAACSFHRSADRDLARVYGIGFLFLLATTGLAAGAALEMMR